MVGEVRTVLTNHRKFVCKILKVIWRRKEACVAMTSLSPPLEKSTSFASPLSSLKIPRVTVQADLLAHQLILDFTAGRALQHTGDVTIQILPSHPSDATSQCTKKTTNASYV